MKNMESKKDDKQSVTHKSINDYGLGVNVDSLDRKKKDLLLCLIKTMGIVSQACAIARVSRASYYNWINDDKTFKEAVEAVEEYSKDFVESKLFKKIQEEDLTAIIFFAKTRMKERGYVERQEIAPISQPRTVVYYPEVQDIPHKEIDENAGNQEEQP